ncbi:MAG: hypothetical protein LLF94_04320 [Chlamydiales bacterium]|nr:hypothetical protein [Chlamydiales bacterium]
MKNSKLLTVLLLILHTGLFAKINSKYDADISWMVADLKYSKEHGVKICEVQHGIASTFFGDLFLNGNDGLLSPKILAALDQYPAKKWTVPAQVSFLKLGAMIKESPTWITFQTLPNLLESDEFVKTASRPPKNPSSLASYKGMIYGRPTILEDYDTFKKNYPGILIIDAATHPYWVDKYEMSRLFTHPKITTIKPEWGLYPKKYTPDLAAQIISDIPSEAYVIKPRGAFLGRGVIIIARDELDSCLHYILHKTKELQDDKDKSYNHWTRDTFDSFIVEKFYPSDPIAFPTLDNKVYDPTMRAAFVMKYDNGKIEVDFLGGYWMAPSKALDEEGTLNERKKAYCKTPNFTHATEEEQEAIRKQIEPALKILYRQMLQQK